MTKRIAWAITGAGCWLFESFEAIGQLLKKPPIDIKVDIYFSRAGREVAQCYGVFKAPIPEARAIIETVREIPKFNRDIFTGQFVEKNQWLGLDESVNDSGVRRRYPLPTSNPNKNSQGEKEEEQFNFESALHDVIFENDEGASFPSAARASIGYYDTIVVSPATSNTVTKINCGIADNLITNLAILGNKSKETEIIIVPTDFKEGSVKSYLPVMIHPDNCKKCAECAALWACKHGAMRPKRGSIRINRLLCIGCLDCVHYCRFGTITFLEEVSVTIRKREAEAVKKLSTQKGFTVCQTPQKALEHIFSKINPS